MEINPSLASVARDESFAARERSAQCEERFGVWPRVSLKLPEVEQFAKTKVSAGKESFADLGFPLGRFAANEGSAMGEGAAPREGFAMGVSSDTMDVTSREL